MTILENNEPKSADQLATTQHFREWLKRDPYMAWHKSIYFIAMGANAAYYPFLVIYLRKIGLSDFEAGIIMACSHAVTAVLSPIVTRFADTSERSRRICLLACWTLGAVLVYCMSFVHNFASAFVVGVLVDGFMTTVWPIMDSSVYACLEATQGNTAAYGNTRAFGALGWGVMAWVFGSILDTYGLEAMFPCFVLCLLPVFILASFVPVEKRGATKGSARNAWRKILTVDIMIFGLVVFITAILLAIVDVFRTPYLASMGASNELLGISITMTSVSEFPFFFVAGWALKRISQEVVLLSVLVAYAIRFAWYAMITDPWWTIPAELLHGVQFALGWAATTSYVATLLPPELSSSAQGMLASIQWGLGPAAGSFCGGWIMQHYGGRAMMNACAILSVIGCVVMAYSMYRKRKHAARNGDGNGGGHDVARRNPDGKHHADHSSEWSIDAGSIDVSGTSINKSGPAVANSTNIDGG